MNGKTKAIVAHIFFIGWIISFILNLSDKEEFTSYFLRQTLLLHVLVLIGWIPVFGWLFWIAGIVLLVISLISAINEEKKEIPFVGSYFQEWFKSF